MWLCDVIDTTLLDGHTILTADFGHCVSDELLWAIGTKLIASISISSVIGV
ncbi:MAG TPA: hypothetical protein VH351_21475 [Bryobacteraceae bacterium]|jgi:hypothetical protein|nr:hypothetical protein [Bryobacteraceae bacterium]